MTFVALKLARMMDMRFVNYLISFLRLRAHFWTDLVQTFTVASEEYSGCPALSANRSADHRHVEVILKIGQDQWFGSESLQFVTG